MNEHPAVRLKNFPVSFFSMVMGLSGLTIAWEKAQATLQLPFSISGFLLLLTGTVFILLALFYLTKLARYPQAVAEEVRHPVKLSFFATVSVSLILLSICSVHAVPVLSKGLWITGTLAQMLFTLYIMGAWIHHENFEIHHMNPAWFIPVVGNILVPIAGVAHGFTEISWFFFSVGLFFGLVLLTIIFYRIIFHQPLPARLLPTLFIFIAPPAVGFLAYVNLTGELDAFARVLYHTGLFLTLLLLTQFRRFARLKFFLSWWAYSFPLAAITVATLLMYERSGIGTYQVLSVILLGLVSLVALMLVVRTAMAVGRDEICVEEG